MEAKKSNRTRIIGLRLSLDEYNIIAKKWKQSDALKLSEYVRKMLFGQPIISNYRNRSLDDFMEEMIRLRRELNECQKAFNENLKRLYEIDRKADVLTWIKLHDVHKRTVQIKIDEIKAKINQVSDKWLQ